MAYTKTNWIDGTTEITAARLNNLESQHELALVDARAASGDPLKAEIVNGKGAAGTAGRLVFDTADNRFYFDTGATWHVAAVADVTQNLNPGPATVTIPAGYHDGTGHVTQAYEVAVPSDTLVASANTERAAGSGSYAKVKEIRVAHTGGYRVKFDLRSEFAQFSYAKVYVESVARGPEEVTSSESYTTYTGEYFLEAGQVVQLYYKGTYARVRNFQVYCDTEAVHVPSTFSTITN